MAPVGHQELPESATGTTCHLAPLEQYLSPEPPVLQVSNLNMVPHWDKFFSLGTCGSDPIRECFAMCIWHFETDLDVS